MPHRLCDPEALYPIVLPDGSAHRGTVHLARVAGHPQVRVGDFTYASDFDPPADDGWIARLAPYLFPFSKERLTIGRFCQIAHGVRFITASANHDFAGITSYPLAHFDPDPSDVAQPDGRDTEVGNDVWLGHGAMVLPGARIGSGVIVGAGSVVRGRVPDYAIVAGNPARIVRMRFSETEIARLLDIAWWNWPTDRIEAASDALLRQDIDALAAFDPQAK